VLALLVPTSALAHTALPVFVATGWAYLVPMVLAILIARKGRRLRWAFLYIVATLIGFGILFAAFSREAFLLALLLPIALLIVAISIRVRSTFGRKADGIENKELKGISK